MLRLKLMSRRTILNLGLTAVITLLIAGGFQNCAGVDHTTNTGAQSASQVSNVNPPGSPTHSGLTPVGFMVDVQNVFAAQESATFTFDQAPISTSDDSCTYHTACGGTGTTLTLTSLPDKVADHFRTFKFSVLPTQVTITLSGNGHAYPPSLTVVYSDGSYGATLNLYSCNQVSDYLGSYSQSVTCALPAAN